MNDHVKKGANSRSLDSLPVGYLTAPLCLYFKGGGVRRGAVMHDGAAERRTGPDRRQKERRSGGDRRMVVFGGPAERAEAPRRQGLRRAVNRRNVLGRRVPGESG